MELGREARISTQAFLRGGGFVGGRGLDAAAASAFFLALAAAAAFASDAFLAEAAFASAAFFAAAAFASGLLFEAGFRVRGLLLAACVRHLRRGLCRSAVFSIGVPC